MSLIKFEDLLDTGAHFGHVTRKWHPNYKPYILMEKNGVHIINLEETISAFNKAASKSSSSDSSSFDFPAKPKNTFDNLNP